MKREKMRFFVLLLFVFTFYYGDDEIRCEKGINGNAGYYLSACSDGYKYGAVINVRETK